MAANHSPGCRDHPGDTIDRHVRSVDAGGVDRPAPSPRAQGRGVARGVDRRDRGPCQRRPHPGFSGRSGARSSPPTGTTTAAREAVHDPALLSFLATAYDEWVAGGYLGSPGQDRVVPYVFPPQLTPGRAPPASSRLGAHRDVRHGHDDADRSRYLRRWGCHRPALTAADLVADGAAWRAMCRPRGTTSSDFYGGSCYLNNAAMAAQHCASAVSRSSGSSTSMPTTATAPRRSSTDARRRIRVGARDNGMVPPLRRLRGKTARATVPAPPEPAVAPWDRRCRVAGGRRPADRVRRRPWRRSSGCLARRRRGSRRPRPVAGHGQAMPRGVSSPVSACPPSSSRKAGTTWTASASWCWLPCSPSGKRTGDGE